jgi:hypothetical protein
MMKKSGLVVALFFTLWSIASIQTEMKENGEACHAVSYRSGERVFLGDLLPPKSARRSVSSRELTELARKIFDKTEIARMTLFEKRVSATMSADTFREMRGEGAVEKMGRVFIRLRSSLASRSFPLDTQGNRGAASPRFERSYVNVYEVWQDPYSREWVGFMRTEEDTAKENSTRGVTGGRLTITAEDCLVWDSVGVHPSYYGPAGTPKRPGLGLTRSQWCVDSGKLFRRSDSITWEVDPKTLKTTGVELERFKNLTSTGPLFLKPPAPSNWEVLTDGTEREGGVSRSEVVSIPNGIRFKGSLGSIEATDKSVVGFAIARIPIILGSASKEFYLKGKRSPEDLKVSVLVRTKNRQVAGINGVLSYNSAVDLSSDLQSVKIVLTDFEPYVRGKKVAPGLAPALRPEEIVDFAVMVRRSDQPATLKAKDPLDFQIDLVSP